MIDPLAQMNRQGNVPAGLQGLVALRDQVEAMQNGGEVNAEKLQELFGKAHAEMERFQGQGGTNATKSQGLTDAQRQKLSEHAASLMYLMMMQGMSQTAQIMNEAAKV